MAQNHQAKIPTDYFLMIFSPKRKPKKNPAPLYQPTCESDSGEGVGIGPRAPKHACARAHTQLHRLHVFGYGRVHLVQSWPQHHSAVPGAAQARNVSARAPRRCSGDREKVPQRASRWDGGRAGTLWGGGRGDTGGTAVWREAHGWQWGW